MGGGRGLDPKFTSREYLDGPLVIAKLRLKLYYSVKIRIENVHLYYKNFDQKYLSQSRKIENLEFEIEISKFSRSRSRSRKISETEIEIFRDRDRDRDRDLDRTPRTEV